MKPTRQISNNSKSFLMPILTVSTISGMAATIRENIATKRENTAIERAKKCEELAEQFLKAYKPDQNFDKKGLATMAKMLSNFNVKHMTKKPIVLASFGAWLAEDLESKRKPSNKKQFVLPESQRQILQNLIQSVLALNTFYDRKGTAHRCYDQAGEMVKSWKKL